MTGLLVDTSRRASYSREHHVVRVGNPRRRRRLSMRNALAIAGILGCAVASLCLFVSADDAVPILFLGRLIDGTGGPAIEDGAVLVIGSAIVAAGPAADVEAPTDAVIVDMDGATILPGFINAHVHNTCWRPYLGIWARRGVTTVRDLGVRFSEGWTACKPVAGGAPQEADVVWAGPLVTVPHGYPICGNDFDSLTVSSPADAREQIEQLIEEGVDVIKIAITINSHCPTLSLDEIIAISETAHAHAISVTAHVESAADAERALEGGVDDLSHTPMTRMSDELIARLVDRGVIMVSTLAVAASHASAAPDNLYRFAQAGGVVALGNDSGYMSGLIVGMPRNEIRALRDAGFSAMDIIVAATRNSAKVCQLLGVVGTLEPGKHADILIVNGNPLEDLETLTSGVLFVMHLGAVIVDRR